MGAAGAGSPYAPGEELFRLADERISESSGIAAGAPGVFFTHNDSGDEARFFAVDGRGCTLAVYRLDGAGAVDWEDAASGPGTLWFGDIGDNRRARPAVDVYAVPEPEVPPAAATGCRPGAQRTRFTRYRLSYRDGAHDAETLLADPDGGRLYIVTKERTGRSGVYAAPARLDPSGENPLERVAEIVFPPSPTRPDPLPADREDVLRALAGRFLATAGAVSPDRSRVVVRTYLDAWEWDLARGVELAATLARPPDRRLRLPSVRQGEAITYAGRDLVTSCEDAGCPVHILRRR